MFRVKICGITSVEDGLLASDAGADAVGLNFYPKSPRCVTVDTAAEICAALPAAVVKVGLFVNSPAGEVVQLFDRLRLDLIQLHGDEPPEYLADLGSRPVMRAFRLDPERLAPIARYLGRCRELRCLPRLALVDSLKSGQYGGTGQVADWTAISGYPLERWHPPLVLAGGLTPANVADAIRAVRPHGVDTASGVETSPGRKSPELVRQFVRAARDALHTNPKRKRG